VSASFPWSHPIDEPLTQEIVYAIANQSQLKWMSGTWITPVADSGALMRGRRELIIRHGGEVYRLRVTASSKLILTK
jgi:hypothetical protein